MGKQTFIENQANNTPKELPSILTSDREREISTWPDEEKKQFFKLPDEERNVILKNDAWRLRDSLKSHMELKEWLVRAPAERLLTSWEKMTEAGVPLRFRKASKSQIHPALWKQIEPFFEGESLYIHGTVGVGKTHLLGAMIREYYEGFQYEMVLDKSTKTHFSSSYPENIEMISLPVLLAGIKAAYTPLPTEDNPVPETAQEMINRYSGIYNPRHWYTRWSYILFLDDIGVERPTDWMLETVYLIINGRYERRKQSVFTSNLSINELSQRLGDRIASRISDMCTVVKIEGKDRRIR